MNKIMICSPGRIFNNNYIKNITNLLYHLNKKGIVYEYYTGFSRNIYETRNMCLLGSPENKDKQVLFDGKEYSHILWIDDDITFNNENFDKLYEANRDVVSGFYLMSNQTHYATVKKWDEKFFEKNGFFEFMSPQDIKEEKLLKRVEYTGFGFILIKKGVFEQLNYPWFEPTHLNIKNSVDFSMEDVTFCLKCKKLNIPIYAHPEVIVGHNKVIEIR